MATLGTEGQTRTLARVTAKAAPKPKVTAKPKGATHAIPGHPGGGPAAPAGLSPHATTTVHKTSALTTAPVTNRTPTTATKGYTPTVNPITGRTTGVKPLTAADKALGNQIHPTPAKPALKPATHGGVKPSPAAHKVTKPTGGNLSTSTGAGHAATPKTAAKPSPGPIPTSSPAPVNADPAGGGMDLTSFLPLLLIAGAALALFYLYNQNKRG